MKEKLKSKNENLMCWCLGALRADGLSNLTKIQQLDQEGEKFRQIGCKQRV